MPIAKAQLSCECKKREVSLWQMQIQRTKYGAFDVIQIKKKEYIIILEPFSTPDMTFKTILMPKVILEKCLSQKKIYSYLTFLTKMCLFVKMRCP